MNKSRKINIKIHIISWDSALKYFTQFILQVRPTNQNGGDRQRSNSLYANDPPTRLHRLEAREANSNYVWRNAYRDACTNNLIILYSQLASANRRPHQILSVTALTLLSFKSTFKKHALRIIFINYISQKQFIISQFLH